MARMPGLLLLSGPSSGLRYDVVDEATLGRSPSCEIPLEDNKVSRRHARIFITEGQTRIADLGSRNGTVVNGEKIEAEAILLPGDRVQVGETTVLYEPMAKAAFSETEVEGGVTAALVEELLPRVGREAALYSAGTALLTATSETMVLRRAAQEALRSLNADCAAAMLGGKEGLLTAAVVGAEKVEIPRSLVAAALERREVGRVGNTLCAPLAASGGAPFGLLYIQRDGSAFEAADEPLAAALGRLAGEAFANVRAGFEGQAASAITLVGTSKMFRKTVEQARRAAAGAANVLLHGEPGTGRRLIAQYIHSRSSRALGPVLEVDCRSPSGANVDEALFGRASAPGVPPLSSALFRADGGTLILLHVDSLPRHTAERLARFLAAKTAPAREGGEEPVDLRVIATSMTSLSKPTQKLELAPELARALGGLEIEVLPLRERKTDVTELFDHFAALITKPLRRDIPQLTPDAKRMLADYAWPQNVYEVRLVAERLASLYAGLTVNALKLPPEIQEGGEERTAPRTLQDRISQLERDAISEALREAKGKKIRAAAILGISRPTLDKKIEDYSLTVEKIRKV